MDKSLLDVIYGGTKHLHKAGPVDTVTQRDFDSLCLPPVKQFIVAQIKDLKQKSRTSQGVFAAYLNTCKTTVQKHKQEAKRPKRASLNLINLVEIKVLEVLTYIERR